MSARTIARTNKLSPQDAAHDAGRGETPPEDRMGVRDDLSVGVPFRAQCPLCDAEIDGIHWVVVDIGNRPELGVRARDGSLHASFCPDCVGPGVEQPGAFCIVRQRGSTLQVKTFVPFGTVDIDGEVHAVRAKLKAANIEELGAGLFENAADVSRTLDDCWPDVRVRFDPTVVPDAVFELIETTTCARRIRTLRAHPDLARANVYRFLEILSQDEELPLRMAAKDAMAFLDLARTIGVRELHGEPARVATPAATAVPEPTPEARWIEQIDEGKIQQVCDEIETAKEARKGASPGGILNDLGTYYSGRGNPERAIVLLDRAASVAEPGSDVTLKATIEGNLGNAYYALERYREALPHFEKAAALYAAGDAEDMDWRLMMLVSVGNCLDLSGQTEDACAQYRRVATLASAAGALAEQSVALGNLGNVFGKRGDFETARTHHAEALEIAWKSEDTDRVLDQARDLSSDLRSLGDSGSTVAAAIADKAARACKQGRHDLARAGFAAAAFLLDEKLAPSQLADLLDAASVLDFALRDLEGALQKNEKAIAIARAQHDQKRTATFLLNSSATNLSAGRLPQAFQAANDAFVAARTADDQATIAKALGNLGIVSEALGQFGRAEFLLTQQLTLAIELKDEPQIAQAKNSLGGLYSKMGLIGRGAEMLEDAASLAEKHGLESLATSCLINRAASLGNERSNRDKKEAMYREAIARAIKLDNADLSWSTGAISGPPRSPLTRSVESSIRRTSAGAQPWRRFAPIST